MWDSVLTSPYGPPPGYLTGGVNPNYRPDGAYRGPPIAPPQNQPVQKSYRDWNTSWPENSWEVSECHIPYQAAYVRLLSSFVTAPPPALGLEIPSEFSAGPVQVRIGGAQPGSLALVFFGLQGATATQFNLPFLCANLGLQLGANPWLHVVCIGQASSNGVVNCSFHAPPVTASFGMPFQAVLTSTCPDPVQSAVVNAYLKR